MNLFQWIFSPVRDLTRAVLLPVKALFVVGLCAAINLMTSPHHWWFQWVAMGMGIAVLVAWGRAARTLIGLALVAWVGRWVYRRYGASAKAQYDAWVARTQPGQAQVLSVLRGMPGR